MRSLKTAKWFILGALMGNIMEFFDFIVYAYLSKYITVKFFPHEDPFFSKLLMFSVFASGYLTRPFGAMIFGYIGDKFGRKVALIQSIVIITVATSCIGLLPTYSDINIIAPILLVICRLVQGFAVSGEQGGVAVYLSESLIGSNKNGLIGSLVLGSSYFGVLLGSLACLIVSSLLSEQMMQDFGWRLPFIFSIVLGLLSLAFRLKGNESAEFIAAKRSKTLSTAPVKEAFQKQWKNLVLMIMLVMSLAVPVYMYTIYLPNYINDILGINFKEGLAMSTISLLFLSILVPIIGIFCDEIGNNKVLLIGLFASLIFGYPVFVMLSQGSLLYLCFGQICLGSIVALIAAPMFAVLLKVFPVHIRYTSVSFVFNTSMAIFGSTAPIVAVILMKSIQSKACPGLYVSLSGAVGLIVLLAAEYSWFFKKNFDTGRLKNASI